MIATSVEQSKRLIGAGVDPKTADCCWSHYVLTYDFGHAMEVSTVEPLLYSYPACHDGDVPAWSLSAIWDLIGETSAVFEFSTSDKSQNVLCSLVENVIRFAKQGRL